MERFLLLQQIVEHQLVGKNVVTTRRPMHRAFLGRAFQVSSFAGRGSDFACDEHGLLSYFSLRVTNATAEGFNSRIQSIKSTARGFRSFKNYRLRTLFYCEKLDLMPKISH